jgi:hypothetical protein
MGSTHRVTVSKLAIPKNHASKVPQTGFEPVTCRLQSFTRWWSAIVIKGKAYSRRYDKLEEGYAIKQMAINKQEKKLLF